MDHMTALLAASYVTPASHCRSYRWFIGDDQDCGNPGYGRRAMSLPLTTNSQYDGNMKAHFLAVLITAFERLTLTSRRAPRAAVKDVVRISLRSDQLTFAYR